VQEQDKVPVTMGKVAPIFCNSGLLKVSTTNRHLLERSFKVWCLFMRGLKSVSVCPAGMDGGMSQKKQRSLQEGTGVLRSRLCGRTLVDLTLAVLNFRGNPEERKWQQQ